LAPGQVPVADNRERRTPDGGGAPVLADDGERQRLAPVRAAVADQVEEAPVLVEAAERDVLAVVGRRRRIACPLGQPLPGPAERRPRLVQRELVARVDELERG